MNQANTRSKISANAPKRILLTGICGALGQLVAHRLKRHVHVIGVDTRPFFGQSKNIEHHQLDLRRKSAFQLIKKREPDAIIHVGVIRNPLKHRDGDAYFYNVEVTSQLVKLAEQLNMKKFVFLSSANLYGPSARTSGFMTEDAPLHGANRSPEIRDLVALDMMIQSFFWKQPQTQTVMLRPVHMVGPHLNNAPSNYFRLKTAPTLLGYDPMLQLVHESDVVNSIYLAAKLDVRGIFNIIGKDGAPVSRILEASGARSLPLPDFLLRGMLSATFRFNLSTYPAGEIDHLKYACLIDGTRAQKSLQYKPQYDIAQIIADLRHH